MSKDGFFILPDLDDEKIIIPDATDISNKLAKNNSQMPKGKQFSSVDCSPEMKQKKPSNDRRTFLRLRAVVIFAVLLLIGYYSVHFWTEGSCTEDSVCTLCGKVRSVAPGHSWNKATCTNPSTCSVCGETQGKAAGHQWNAATCTVPKTCRVCEETTGTVLTHDWQDATCTQPATCIRCGQTTGTNSHNWTDKSTDVLKKCSICLKQVEFFYSPQDGELLAWTEYELVNNQKTNPVSYSARDEKRLDWDLTGESNYETNRGDNVHLFYVKGKMYYFDRGNHKMNGDIAYNLAVVGSRYTKVTQYLWEEDDELLNVQLAVDGESIGGITYPIPDIVGSAYAVFDADGTPYVIVSIIDSDKVYAIKSNWKK